jgi:ABC-type Fe3+/spermidine/putrescine transport system ATPase subunit
MTSVVLKDLTRRFGMTTAVSHLNLAITSGEMVALLGPSGCGKTTTLRMIAGLLTPSSGDICFDDRSILAVPAEKRGAVMVFQKHLLFPTMNVAQNVGFGLRMQGLKWRAINARVSEMLHLVKLPGFETRRIHELSSGQQQRIALARALIIQPKVLLLDEPLANLDANLRLEMRELIRSIQRTLQITTIVVTHDQEEAVMLADRVALMFEGVLHQYDVPRAFYERPQSIAVAHFFRNDNLLLGVKQGQHVATRLGDLAIDPHRIAIADGPVLLTVRPEDVELVAFSKPAPNEMANESQGERSASNLALGVVIASVYMGVYTQVQLNLDGVRWQAHASAELNLQPGDKVGVHLPKQRIWLLPGDIL